MMSNHYTDLFNIYTYNLLLFYYIYVSSYCCHLTGTCTPLEISVRTFVGNPWVKVYHVFFTQIYAIIYTCIW